MPPTEPEVLCGRRAFPKAQELFEGAPLRTFSSAVVTGWHDTLIHPEAGAFALVRTAAGLDDLIGEVLRVSTPTRHAYVYCLGSANLPTDLSLARRAFAALGLLALESLVTKVEVIG